MANAYLVHAETFMSQRRRKEIVQDDCCVCENIIAFQTRIEMFHLTFTMKERGTIQCCHRFTRTPIIGIIPIEMTSATERNN